MSNTPAACEVEVTSNNLVEVGEESKCDEILTTNNINTNKDEHHEQGPMDVVMGDTHCVHEDEVNVVISADKDNSTSEDNGEASDETSSRRESNSSAEGVEDMDAATAAQLNNHNNNEGEDDTTKLLNQLDNTNNNTSHTTPRKKKKKRRSKRSKSRTHSRSVSRHNSAPDLTTPTTTTTTSSSSSSSSPTTTTTTTTTEDIQHKTQFDEISHTEPLPEHLLQDINSSESFPSSSSDSAHIPPHLLELTPPPTRGRSNAFYGSKAVPPLIHSNSDGAAIIAAQNTSAALSPKRNTVAGALTSPLPIPEPSHSGISKPKLFNYWRLISCCQNFAGPVYEKSIVSHSKRFLVGFAETIGRRPSMEDYMVVHGAFRGRGQEDYFALFDGHGGKDAAAFAATHLHEVLAEKLKTNNAVKSLKEAFADTHKMISDQKIIGGTTAVVALFIGKKGFIANVGDTRAVLCRDGVPLRVSLDHKPELPTESSRIRKLGGTITTTYNSAGIATSRVNGMLAVSRALGDTPLHPYVSSDPEIHGPLNLDDEAKDQFVVLACDGVWDVLTDEEATSIVAPIANPEIASRRLRDEAFARGSTDNISVMVIRCPPFLACD